MKNSLLLPVFLIAIAVLLLVLMVMWSPQEKSPQAGNDLPAGGDFVLQGFSGPVDLKQYRGKVVALYFGYTWCPDICPTNLGMLSSALNELPRHQLEQFQGFFISIDPERDTLERLRDYGQYFNPRIMGITGSDEEVKRVARQYGSIYQKVAKPESEDYLVDHSSRIYLLDKQGKLRQILPHATPPDQILIALNQLLQEK